MNAPGARPPRWRSFAWALIALPAIGQIWLLLGAFFGRVTYGYDLEWMEGGLLHHAARIRDGAGIYVEPSVDFIPYLYTPLYPALLAVLEPVAGLSYGTARTISVLSVFGLVALVYVIAMRGAGPERRGVAAIGATLGVGFIAATYPFVEGWLDIARPDSLFTLMVVGGLTALVAWSRTSSGWQGNARVACAAAILALSFFCKQTGVLYVAAGGALLVVLNYRRLPVYVATAGIIGLGGCWVLNQATDGWFWTYVFEVHQAHDTNMDRFWASFGNILGEFPAMPSVVGVALLTSLAAGRRTGETPRSARTLYVWTFVFAVSCVVGALGWSTQWAHFNAYIPALVTGSIACATALPALADAFSALRPRAAPTPGAPAIAIVAGAILALELVGAWWAPGDFTPTAADSRAGDALVEYLGSIDGEVLVPFHPWYARLANKRVFVHRMGVKDMSSVDAEARAAGRGAAWQVRDLEDWIRDARFAAIVWDDRPVDFPGVRRAYRLDDHLPDDLRPRTFTGARVRPKQVWVPAAPVVPPPGTRVLFNFESGRFDGWTVEGTAWGNRPASGPVKEQGPVRRYGGRYFLTSMNGGDNATGTLFSPPFEITGSRISFRISGGKDDERLRAELQIDGQTVDWATGNDSERMEERGWRVAPYKGQTARIVLKDNHRGSWGHLSFDEIWIED